MTRFVFEQKKREWQKRMDREFDDYFNGTLKTVALMDKEDAQKQR